MNKEISIRDTIVIGLMLFALFFGAGNLVFPAMLGQASGIHYWQANLGFLITGVGLPLLAIMAFGISGKRNLLSLASRVHPVFGVIYTTLLYLSIGPLFAMPRTGSVSYEIAIKPFVSANFDNLALLLFSVIFFVVTLIFSLNPTKIIDVVGRALTPLLILFIAILVITVIMNPLGEPQLPIEAYKTNAFFNGFQEGYLTMDTLAAFVFGIIVIDILKIKGANTKKKLIITCFQSAIIAALILAIIYTSLTYIGAVSVEQLGHLENGGEVLSNVSNYYFGTFGGFMLGVIVLLACLTTSIGLTTACSSYFHKLFPKISYKTFAVILVTISALLANVGLNELINISVPVLSILYPLAIVLIFLTFLHSLFKGKRTVYWLSLLFTLVVSTIDVLSETAISTKLHLSSADQFLSDFLPLYNLGLGWLIPAIVGGILGLLIPGFLNKEEDV